MGISKWKISPSIVCLGTVVAAATDASRFDPRTGMRGLSPLQHMGRTVPTAQPTCALLSPPSHHQSSRQHTSYRRHCPPPPLPGQHPGVEGNAVRSPCQSPLPPATPTERTATWQDHHHRARMTCGRGFLSTRGSVWTTKCLPAWSMADDSAVFLLARSGGDRSKEACGGTEVKERGRQSYIARVARPSRRLRLARQSPNRTAFPSTRVRAFLPHCILWC